MQSWVEMNESFKGDCTSLLNLKTLLTWSEQFVTEKLNTWW